MRPQLSRPRKIAWKTGKALGILSVYIFGLLLLFLLNLGRGFSESTGLVFYTITVSLILILFPLSIALLLWAKQRLTPLTITGLLIIFASAFIFLVPVTVTSYKPCQSVKITLWQSIGFLTTRVGFRYVQGNPLLCYPTII